MCPTGIVLTDSPYDSATDTLAEKRVQKYGKSRKGCSRLNEKLNLLLDKRYPLGPELLTSVCRSA